MSKKIKPLEIDYQVAESISNELIAGKAPTLSYFFNVRTVSVFLGTTYVTASEKGSISNTLAVNITPGTPWFIPTDPHILKGNVTKLITDECSLLWALYQINSLKDEEFMKTVNHVNIFGSSVVLMRNYKALISLIRDCKNTDNIEQINKLIADKRRTPRSCRIIKAVAEMPYQVNFYFAEKFQSSTETRFKTVFEDVNGIKLSFWDFRNISAGVAMSAAGVKKFAFTDKSVI